jgi:hypothetical protein
MDGSAEISVCDQGRRKSSHPVDEQFTERSFISNNKLVDFGIPPFNRKYHWTCHQEAFQRLKCMTHMGPWVPDG